MAQLTLGPGFTLTGFTLGQPTVVISNSTINDPYSQYVTLLLNANNTGGTQNNTFLDSSSNNFSITRNGNTTQGSFSPYGSNWSNYFNGTTDYLYAGQNDAFSFGTGNFTVEFFVYTSSATMQMVYDTIQPGISGGAGNRFFIYINSDQTVISGSATNFLTTTLGVSLPTAFLTVILGVEICGGLTI